MKYYLAPMEGLTTYTFRRTWNKYYGGADALFTPFISNRHMNSRERNDILPEHNLGMHTVPQILTNKADEFLELAADLADYGYKTVNLNLGCPSGTVVARKRGAGFLSVPDALERFLDEIFEKCPLKISVKTRIGMENADEWEGILALYRRYPLEELIIHPRLQKEGYGGTPHLDAFAKAAACLSVPLCYNGDLVSPASLQRVLKTLPGVNCVMVGRGILQNPGLFDMLRASVGDSMTDGKASVGDSMTDGKDTVGDSMTNGNDTTAAADAPCKATTQAQTETLHAFLDELLEGYQKIMSGDTNTLYKMKDLWTFLGQGFESPDKYLKKIRKANRIAEYQLAVDLLLRECPLSPVLRTL